MNGKSSSCLRLSLAGASLAWSWFLSPALAETDADIAQCLATGRIVEADEVLVGLTQPLKTVAVSGVTRERAIVLLVGDA